MSKTTSSKSLNVRSNVRAGVSVLYYNEWFTPPGCPTENFGGCKSV